MTAWLALSLMPDDGWRRAALPLFEQGLVDALEWSFDAVWDRVPPRWLPPLVEHYAAADRLWAHGVSFSPGSVDGTTRHDAWLARLAADRTIAGARGISEHLGFMVAGPHDAGAPLPLTDGAAAREVSTANLMRLAQTTGMAVGLENLALALHPDDVWRQGDLIAAVLAAVDGYYVLDLHNLWCQLVNFGLDAADVLANHPLARVTCVHLSGGSWWTPPGATTAVRRDTHDGAVPQPLLELFSRVLPWLPALEVVVLERLGDTLRDERDAAGFEADVLAIRERLAHATPSPPPFAAPRAPLADDLDRARLGDWQHTLIDASAHARDASDLRARMLAALPWAAERIAALDGRGLAIAVALAQRWSPTR